MRGALIAALILATVAAEARPREFAISQTEQVTRGLVSYWSMRTSGTTVYDEKGANNGTAAGGVTFAVANGVVGSGGGFDGTNDYVNCGAFNPTGNGGQRLSAFAWVKSDALQSDKQIISQYRTDTNERAWQIGTSTNGNNKLRAYITYNGSFSLGKIYESTSAILDTQWNHVGFTWSSGTLVMYFNGAAIAVEKIRDDVFSSITTPTANIFIGDRESSGTAFDGSIDEVRIYNVALTAEEIKQLYRMGATIFANR